MTFFNNMNCFAFIYGNIINNNQIFKILKQDKIVARVNSDINNIEILKRLNGIFTPIQPKINTYDQTSNITNCSFCNSIIIKELEDSNEDIILNNTFIKPSMFKNLKLNKLISEDNILILSSKLSYIYDTELDNEA